jgi:pimeloyl-ACP methyl ester carboxylesterase
MPPLVMLHGWGQSYNSLSLLGNLLSKSRAVHLVDLPGFGASPKPESDWGTAEYADCILAYLQEQRLDQVDVLGHSFGGRIALQLAAKAPLRIRKLVLVNAAGLQRKPRGLKALRAIGAKISLRTCRFLDSSFSLHTFEQFHVPRFASRDYLNAGELRRIFVKTVNEDLSDIARTVSIPVLLLWGERDEEVPVEIGRRYHDLLVNSQLVVLPGKDHFPFLNEGAHLCAYHVLKFLDPCCSNASAAHEGKLSHV